MITSRAIQIARDFIARHEGWSDEVYLDSAGLPTIGYGHLILPDESFPDGITQEEGWALLESDMSQAIECVDTRVDVDLEDWEAAALISFVYNVGCGAFRGSTMVKLLNSGQKDKAMEQFKRWNKAGGKEVKGLTNRRLAEAELFSGVAV